MRLRDQFLEADALFGGEFFRDLLRSHFDDARLAPGVRVGAYRIVRELGRGGMGVVYLAERADGEFEQQVALKCLEDAGPSPERNALLRRERQFLAELSHPSIARLIDGGCTDAGQPWFAMEYVEGLPIDQHADAHALDARQRVMLVLPVLQAIEFAHGRLLIHRDIKPGNVLVDAQGRARLLDFGIAGLAQEHDQATAFTPGYASPEQRAMAHVGVASDIWQAGRLLDELLQPVRNTRRSDLDAILAKAQANRPEDRYRTMSALISDLQCWLERRPVSAHPGGMPYRLRKLFSRHPVPFTGGLVSVATIVALVCAFTLHTVRERDRLRLAQAESSQIQRFLKEDVLMASDPFLGDPQSTTLVASLVKGADRIQSRFAGQPAVAGELDLIFGDALVSHGRYGEASVAIDRAIARLMATKGATSPSTLYAQLLRADLDNHMGNPEAAMARLKTVDLRRAPQDARTRELRWYRDDSLAWSAYLSGDFRRCHQIYRSMLADRRGVQPVALGVSFTGDSICRSYLGDGVGGLEAARAAQAIAVAESGEDSGFASIARTRSALPLLVLGRREEARQLLSEEVAHLGRIVGPGHATTVTSRHRLGAIELCMGRADEAERHLRQSVDGLVATYGRDHPWIIGSRTMLARARMGQRDFDGARAALSGLEAHPRRSFDWEAALSIDRAFAELRLRTGDSADALRLFHAARTLATEPDRALRGNLAAIDRGIALTRTYAANAGRTLPERDQRIIDDALSGNCMD